MRPSIRSRLAALVRGQWAGLLALFLVIAGGTAYAADTVFSTDIVNGEVKAVDIGNNQVLTADVRNEHLTGADVKDQSGVDTCTHGTARFGELCVLGTGQEQTWVAALTTCRARGLRPPTLGEALALATVYDVPTVGFDDSFWTDDSVFSADSFRPFTVDEDANWGANDDGDSWDTVCVTTPTN